MVSLDLVAAANDLVMEQLTWVLEQRTPGAPATPLQPPTYNGEDEVTQFVQQFKDVTVENQWTESKALLYLRNSLLGPVKAYGNADTTEVVFQALQNQIWDHNPTSQG